MPATETYTGASPPVPVVLGLLPKGVSVEGVFQCFAQSNGHGLRLAKARGGRISISEAEGSLQVTFAAIWSDGTTRTEYALRDSGGTQVSVFYSDPSPGTRARLKQCRIDLKLLT